ncbi:hypothetical protein [Lentzea sp.]|uniref:hypothetical protein n=1 Tax=Lentzea sp. TaxID=56099 RepID=UPI002ED1C0E2
MTGFIDTLPASEPVEVAPAVQGVWLAWGSVTVLHQPALGAVLTERGVPHLPPPDLVYNLRRPSSVS